MKITNVKGVSASIMNFVVIGTVVVPALLIAGTAAATAAAFLTAAGSVYAYFSADNMTVVTISDEEMAAFDKEDEDV